jgi:Putative zinc dependent peptidase (DUF5700)
MTTAMQILISMMLLGMPAEVKAESDFDVRLILDFQSADKTIELYNGLSGRPEEIAMLRGSQIALATTAMIAQQPLGMKVLESSLQAIKFGQTPDNDILQMKEARQNLVPMTALVEKIKSSGFAQKVVSTVEQLFPAGTKLSTTVPVYFVAFGHPNIDGYVRRVVWQGNSPVFVGEGEGQVTIVVNLARAVYYGRSVEEQFIGTLSVVAHEVFHAAFGVYKDNSPDWKEYYAKNRRPIDQLFDLVQNEGIAYYLSLIQRTRGVLSPEGVENARNAVREFNGYARELLDPRISPRRASEIIRKANTSGYWESFGSITGMIIARAIDQNLGRTALSTTIASGPKAFMNTYVDLMYRNTDLPPLSTDILRYLGRSRY